MSVCREWDEEECLVAKREAIVDWLEASKSMYRHQWACTAVDMSIHVNTSILLWNDALPMVGEGLEQKQRQILQGAQDPDRGIVEVLKGPETATATGGPPPFHTTHTPLSTAS